MSEPPEIRVCAVCGRVLDYVSDRGWLHTAQDRRNEDHPAVPVTTDEIETIGRCDFCNEDFPAWVVPCRDFPTPMNTMSRGNWAACDKDADLIRKNQWNKLTTRISKIAGRRHGLPPEFMEQMLRPLYRDLRKNMTGPVRRPDPNRFGA